MRPFLRTLRLLIPMLALLALAYGHPRVALAQDDAGSPDLTEPMLTDPSAEPSTEPMPEVGEEPAEPAQNARERLVQHESGIPYISASTEVDAEIAEAYHLADQLMAEGKYAEALSTLGSLNFLAATEMRVKALAAMGQSQQALAILESLIRSYRSQGATVPWPILETRGDIYLEEELFDQAIEDYRAAVEGSFGFGELQRKLGLAQVRFGIQLGGTNRQSSFQQLRDGIDSLDAAVEDGYDDAEVQGYLGIAKSETGDVEGAIENFLSAIAMDPEYVLYHQLLGNAYLNQAGQKAAADPEDKPAIMEQFELALEQYNISLELEPGDFSESEDNEGDSPEEDLGLDLGLEGEMPEAATATDEEEEDADFFEPYSPELVYGWRAMVRIAIGDLLTDREERDAEYQAAIADCDLALKLNERNPTPYLQKGIALRMMGEMEPAVEAFTEALKLAPGMTEASLRRGIAWYHLGEHDLARMDFEDVNRYEFDSRAGFWTGLTHAAQGNYYDAIEHYSNVLREAPDHQMAHLNRGLAYMQMDQPERALNDFNEVIRRDQANSDAYYYRGWALDAMDNPTAAMRSYQRALDLNPQQMEATEKLNAMDEL